MKYLDNLIQSAMVRVAVEDNFENIPNFLYLQDEPTMEDPGTGDPLEEPTQPTPEGTDAPETPDKFSFDDVLDGGKPYTTYFVYRYGENNKEASIIDSEFMPNDIDYRLFDIADLHIKEAAQDISIKVKLTSEQDKNNPNWINTYVTTTPVGFLAKENLNDKQTILKLTYNNLELDTTDKSKLADAGVITKESMDSLHKSMYDTQIKPHFDSVITSARSTDETPGTENAPKAQINYTELPYNMELYIEPVNPSGNKKVSGKYLVVINQYDKPVNTPNKSMISTSSEELPSLYEAQKLYYNIIKGFQVKGVSTLPNVASPMKSLESGAQKIQKGLTGAGKFLGNKLKGKA